MNDARQAAFDVLLKIERSGAYSNLALDAAISSFEDRRDSALASALVCGVSEKLITLDYNISLCLSRSINRLRPEIKTALRLGAYQLFFMDRIPDRAAVGECVRIVKNSDAGFMAGLVNGVLRTLSREGLRLPEDDGSRKFMSVKYSVPEELIALWENAYGSDRTHAILEASLVRPSVTVRVNTLLTDAEALTALFEKEGVSAVPHAGAPDMLDISGAGNIERLETYEKGLFHVQDAASALCCAALRTGENMTVRDVCAAPGGKSFTLAQMMNNTGSIYSVDLYEQRVELIRSGAKRLGIKNIRAFVGDSSHPNPTLPEADRVLCDVPCSGFGVIAKKPEIRYKELKDIDKLPDLQYSILYSASLGLKIGGRLVYSTCTLNPAENDAVCERFLAENPGYSYAGVFEGGEAYPLTVFPGEVGSDGFFIAAFDRRA